MTPAQLKSARERKIRFMADFGGSALRAAVAAAFDRNGPAWLTDDQLNEIVSQAVSDWRFTQRLHRENRAITKRGITNA